MENISRLRYARGYGCDEIDGDEDELVQSIIDIFLKDNSTIVVAKDHDNQWIDVRIYLKATKEDINRLNEKCKTMLFFAL